MEFLQQDAFLHLYGLGDLDERQWPHTTWYALAEGQGLATRACAALLRELRESVAHIGLNVKADNHGAIACYRRLGFAVAAQYGEFSLETRKA